MRILICASSAPLPPMNGFRLLLGELVAALRVRNEVRVVAPVHGDQMATGVHDPDLSLCAAPHRTRIQSLRQLPGALVRGRPLTDDRLAARVWPLVERELTTFSPDVVHVTSGRMAALGRRLTGVPTLLGAVDARHLNLEARASTATGPFRLALRDEARRVRRLIAADYRRFGHVTAVTTEDREALLDVDPQLEISVVPNGVDTSYFRPLAGTAPDPNRVVFTGTMGYAPNVTAAEFLANEVLPRLRRRRPANLVLAGRNPAPAVSLLDRAPDITVTGEVPDIRPWLVGSRVFAAPMRSGTGIKNKLLEAMACGLPCVVSPLSLQGTRCRDGRELLVAETAEETAEALARIMDDDALAARLGRSARTYVERHHSWSAVGRVYERLFADLAAGGAGDQVRPVAGTTAGEAPIVGTRKP